MTPAQALSFESIAYAPPAGELLRGPWATPAKARVQPLADAALAQPARESIQPGRAWLWIALVIAAHALIAWQFLSAEPRSVVKTAPQEIELLRPQEIEPEPPKPLPPQAQPKPVQQQVATPAPQQPALRTAPAEAPVANAISIPENLSAAPSAAPVVAAAPVPPPAPKVEEPLVEPSAYAGYLNNPPPVYPKAAQRQGLQGRVLLRVHVLANGQVGRAELKESSGKPVLDEAALAAVRGWTFVPGKRGNTPVEAWTTVPIDFKLAS